MTKEEILAMEPGRELDMVVAKYVMDCNVVEDPALGDMQRHVVDNSSVWDTLPLYSEDMFATLSVAERMTQLGYEDAYSWDQYGGGIYTRAEAICKRALLIVLGLFDDKLDV